MHGKLLHYPVKSVIPVAKLANQMDTIAVLSVISMVVDV